MLNEPDSGFLEVNGFQIHISKMGSGEPVFTLLHGLGASIFSWREVIQPISELGRVITYDRLGFGFSSRPEYEPGSTQNPYGNQYQVELLFQILDSLGIKKTILVGHSMGGLIALKAAIQQPERIKGLVLIAPAVLHYRFMPKWIKPFLYLPSLKAVFKQMIKAMLRNKLSILKKAWFQPQNIDAEVKKGYFTPFDADGAIDGLYWFAAAPAISLTEDEISSIQIPALIIHGSEDKVVPIKIGRRVARLISGSHFVEFPACGHLPHEEKPLEFMHELIQFVEKIQE